MYNKIWHKYKFVRDLMYWNYNRKYLKWLKFAQKHSLFVDIKKDWLESMLKDK